MLSSAPAIVNTRHATTSTVGAGIVDAPGVDCLTDTRVRGRNFLVFLSTFFRSSGLLELIAFQSFSAAGEYPQ